MSVALPTRMVSGAIVSATFAVVGSGLGFGLPVVVHSGEGIATPAISLALFLTCAWYISAIWRRGVHRDPASRVRALSPRLQAVIFAICLGLGLVVGAFVACAHSAFS